MNSLMLRVGSVTVTLALAEYAAACSAEPAPRAPDAVYDRFQAGQVGRYTLESIPKFYADLSSSISADDLKAKLEREGPLPYLFEGENPRLGYVQMYVFQVWESELARLMGYRVLCVDITVGPSPWRSLGTSKFPWRWTGENPVTAWIAS